jgi:hypothetical protein
VSWCARAGTATWRASTPLPLTGERHAYVAHLAIKAGTYSTRPEHRPLHRPARHRPTKPLCLARSCTSVRGHRRVHPSRGRTLARPGCATDQRSRQNWRKWSRWFGRFVHSSMNPRGRVAGGVSRQSALAATACAEPTGAHMPPRHTQRSSTCGTPPRARPRSTPRIASRVPLRRLCGGPHRMISPLGCELAGRAFLGLEMGAFGGGLS